MLPPRTKVKTRVERPGFLAVVANERAFNPDDACLGGPLTVRQAAYCSR